MEQVAKELMEVLMNGVLTIFGIVVLLSIVGGFLYLISWGPAAKDHFRDYVRSCEEEKKD